MHGLYNYRKSNFSIINNQFLRTRDVKIFFLIFDSRNQKFDFFRLSFISRREKLVQTGVKSGCVSSTRWRFVGITVCSSVSRSSPAASAAAVVHSSNSHCLAHTSFGKRNSHPGIVGQRLLRWRTGAHQLRQDKADIKRHPPPTCYVVVQLISRANVCRYHRRVSWKRYTESWNLTLTGETGSFFSKNTSKPPIACSQFRLVLWRFWNRNRNRGFNPKPNWNLQILQAN